MRDELRAQDTGGRFRQSWPINQGLVIASCFLLAALAACAPTQRVASKPSTAVVAEKSPAERELDLQRDPSKRKQASYHEKNSEAEAAERIGDLRRAVKLYTAALTYADQPELVQQTLGKVARLTAKLTPPPAIPPEAYQQAVAGEALLKRGKTRNDFSEAAEHFSNAARLAPWRASIHYDLALACEAAGDPAAAARAYKAYLIVESETPHKANVQTRISFLQTKAQEAAAITRWLGRWRGNFDSLLASSLDGVVWTLRMVEPSTRSARNGWKPNDILFQGTLQGGRVRGWTAVHGLCESTNRPQYCKNCLGEVLWFQSVMELSSDDKKLLETMRYFWPPFPTPTGSGCIFNSTARDTKQFEYSRLAE